MPKTKSKQKPRRTNATDQVKRTAPPEPDSTTPLQSHPPKKLKHASLASLSFPQQSHIKVTDQPKIEVTQGDADLGKKYGRKIKFHVAGPKLQVAENVENLKVEVATEVSEVQKVTNEVESSVTRGLSVGCMSGSVTEENSLPKEDMNQHKELGVGGHQKEDGSLEIKQTKYVLQSTRSQSVDTNDAAAVLQEMAPENYKTTEAESSVISGLEQTGSQTMSIDRTDRHRKIIKVAGESGGNLLENEEQSQVICYNNDSGDNEAEEGQDLPFVKSLQIWEAIESMETFKVLPQNPHFRPLVKTKEILREGLAVGYMLSFASLVQKTSKLRVVDPTNLFTSILDGLPEFEVLGFDVKAVKNRTSDLLLMKDTHRHLQHHSKEVELQVEQYSDELAKINEEIDENYKMVRELKEKQALLLSSKKSKISEISSLQERADVNSKDLENVKANFESLASSTW